MISYFYCFPLNKSLFVMKAHQRGGGPFQVKSILSFVFDVLELFLMFKMTPHLSKLIKALKFHNWKKIGNSCCFLYYFLNVFIFI